MDMHVQSTVILFCLAFLSRIVAWQLVLVATNRSNKVSHAMYLACISRKMAASSAMRIFVLHVPMDSFGKWSMVANGVADA